MNSGKINILHSFPENYAVFKEYCKLTFDLTNVENEYINSLEEAEHLEPYDIIVLHYLREQDINFILKTDIPIPVVLFSWGADLFNLGKFYNQFLLKKTKALRSRLYVKEGLFTAVKKHLHTILPGTLDLKTSYRNRRKALKKIDYIVPVMPGDYHQLRENYGIQIPMFHLNYVNPAITEKITFASGNNILLGNSASYTNNHLEAIDKLTEIPLKGRKIIIPLSYGDKALAAEVRAYAFKKLGTENVRALTEFLPFDEYSELLNSCEIVVMNHVRQQAVGNIVQALAQGSHLYIRKESPVYEYLHENGIRVSVFENSSELKPLSEKEKTDNSELTRSVFSSQEQHAKLQNILSSVLQQKN